MADWKLLNNTPKPKLLDDEASIMEYGKKLGEEMVDFRMKDNRSQCLYGLARDNQIVNVSYLSKSNASRYAFAIYLDFTRLGKEKRVTVAEAVELVRGYLPYDLMNRYYTLLFARKRMPTAKNINGVVKYEVVYARLNSEVNKADIRRMELPKNICINIMENLDKDVQSIGINCYSYTPDVIGIKKLVRDEAGEIVAVKHGVQEVSPFEGNDGWNTFEQWPNPF